MAIMKHTWLGLLIFVMTSGSVVGHEAQAVVEVNASYEMEDPSVFRQTLTALGVRIEYRGKLVGQEYASSLFLSRASPEVAIEAGALAWNYDYEKQSDGTYVFDGLPFGTVALSASSAAQAQAWLAVVEQLVPGASARSEVTDERLSFARCPHRLAGEIRRCVEASETENIGSAIAGQARFRTALAERKSVAFTGTPTEFAKHACMSFGITALPDPVLQQAENGDALVTVVADREVTAEWDRALKEVLLSYSVTNGILIIHGQGGRTCCDRFLSVSANRAMPRLPALRQAVLSATGDVSALFVGEGMCVIRAAPGIVRELTSLGILE